MYEKKSTSEYADCLLRYSQMRTVCVSLTGLLHIPYILCEFLVPVMWSLLGLTQADLL